MISSATFCVLNLALNRNGCAIEFRQLESLEEAFTDFIIRDELILQNTDGDSFTEFQGLGSIRTPVHASNVPGNSHVCCQFVQLPANRERRTSVRFQS